MNMIHYVIGTTTNDVAPHESLHNTHYQTLNAIHPLNIVQKVNEIQSYGVPTILFFPDHMQNPIGTSVSSAKTLIPTLSSPKVPGTFTSSYKSLLDKSPHRVL